MHSHAEAGTHPANQRKRRALTGRRAMNGSCSTSTGLNCVHIVREFWMIPCMPSPALTPGKMLTWHVKKAEGCHFHICVLPWQQSTVSSTETPLHTQTCICSHATTAALLLVCPAFQVQVSKRQACRDASVRSRRS